MQRILISVFGDFAPTTGFTNVNVHRTSSLYIEGTRKKSLDAKSVSSFLTPSREDENKDSEGSDHSRHKVDPGI